MPRFAATFVRADVIEYHKVTGREIVAVSASKGGTHNEEWLCRLIDDEGQI